MIHCALLCDGVRTQLMICCYGPLLLVRPRIRLALGSGLNCLGSIVVWGLVHFGNQAKTILERKVSEQ